VHSPLLPAARRGTKFTGLFHMIDWTRTFVEGVYGAAGVAVLDGDEAHQDSFNQMGALQGANAPPRRMILHNIDDCSASSDSTSYSPVQCVFGRCFARRTDTLFSPAPTCEGETTSSRLTSICCDLTHGRAFVTG
jgi:hypothetical protein